MKTNPITKLRNRFWLILSSSFLGIFLFALVAIYLSYSLSTYQQIQMMVQARREEMRGEWFWQTSSSFEFLISETMVQDEFGEWDLHYTWISPFELTEKEVLELVEATRNQPTGIRDRLLWIFSLPFVEFQNQTWIYHVETWEWDWFAPEGLAFQDPTHLVFTDVTPNLQGLPVMRRNLIHIGIGGTAFFMLFSYLLASALTKPSLRAFERQQQFIADASHELKTPLQIIKSNTAILAMNPTDSQKKWLNNIQFGIQRMSDLTTDLLTLASLEGELPKSEFDFGETIKTTLQPLKLSLAEKNISLTVQLEEHIKIRQNQEKMVQLVVILLDNAIKYTNEGGWLAITLSRKGNQARLVFKNSGAGIAPDQIKKIFQRFYRADDARNSQSGSYGLGLSIAKGIVEQGGGKISVRSVPGVETSFVVRFRCW